jgi:Ribbon-helix-helix protein, copG family
MPGTGQHRGRSRGREYAERVNAAADLADAGVSAAEAARRLAERFGCSPRQARRYVERAALAGRAVAPQATTVFTVKLPAALAARVRAHAREAGVTISALVAQALEEFLARGRRDHPRR